MAIAFTDLFTALGKLVGGLNEWNTGLGTTLTARVATLRTQLTGIDPDLDDDLTANQDQAVGSGTGWAGYLATAAGRTIVEAVLDDRPLTDQSFTACLTELVRQMNVAAESLATSAATVGSVTDVGTPTGTPKILTSTIDPYTAANSNYALADAYVIEATSATQFSVQGNAAVDQTNPNWPTGSGVNTTVTQIDASETSLGADPGFEDWAVGPPATLTQWSDVGGGTPGTNVAQATGTPITGVGTYCLQLLGDGTTLRVRQLVNVTANTVYSLHAFFKRTANPANTGTITVALRDSSGNVLSGTSSISVATGSVATSWTANTAALATPTNLPSDGLVYLEIRYTGGIGDTIQVDQVALNEYPALYTAGLRIAFFRGATANAIGDTRTLAVTRTSPTLSFIRGLNRLLNLTSYTVRIPTSGSPTQADALVS